MPAAFPGIPQRADVFGPFHHSPEGETMSTDSAVLEAASALFQGEIVAAFEGIQVVEVAGMFAVHDDFSDAPECPAVFGRFGDAYRAAIRIADRVAVAMLPRIVAGKIARRELDDAEALEKLARALEAEEQERERLEAEALKALAAGLTWYGDIIGAEDSILTDRDTATAA